MKDNQKTVTIIFILWCSIVAVWLYGAVLKLPFFFDDFVERPYVDSLTLSQIWQTAGDLAYFRPLLFTIWKAITLLPASLSPALEHALNLLFFIGDALLVGWLAGSLWSAPISGGTSWRDARAPMSFDWPRAFLAATLFLFFPFSYQAVPWLGSLSHILNTFLILATIATYWQWRKSGRWSTKTGRRWAIISLLLALATPFAHENGILIPPLILALHLFVDSNQSSTPNNQLPITNYALRITHYVPWFIPTLIWLPIWWLAPKAVGGAIEVQGGETLLQNTIYFLQGIAYPFTWPGGWLRETAALNDLLVAGGLSLIGLITAGIVLWRGKADRRSLFPLFWVIIAAVPTIFLLRFDYIINGPRLLLLAGVGAVWLWTDVIITTLKSDRTAVQGFVRPVWWRFLLVSGLLLIVLVQNGRFIKTRMNTHQLLGDVYTDVVEAASQVNQRGQPAAFINLPSWITPDALTYAVGHEGVQFWPDYAQPHTLASITTGEDADIILIRNEAIRPEMPYFYGLSGNGADWSALAQMGAAVFVTEYQPQEIKLHQVGSFGNQETADPPLVSFNGGQVFLESAKAAPTEGGTAVRLRWQVVEPPPESLTVFIHAIDEGGQLLIQGDGDPIAGSFPLGQWPSGLMADDQRLLPIGGSGLRLLIGLYDRNTGERWTAETAEGELLPDNALILPADPSS